MDDHVPTMAMIPYEVLSYIMSFLPPNPYLFVLQRVCGHWKELIRQCLKEDVHELVWKGVVYHSDIEKLEFALSHFTGIKKLVICSFLIDSKVLITLATMVPNLQHLCLTNCDFLLDFQVHPNDYNKFSKALPLFTSTVQTNWHETLEKLTLQDCDLTKSSCYGRYHVNIASGAAHVNIYALISAFCETFPLLRTIDLRFINRHGQIHEGYINDRRRDHYNHVEMLLSSPKAECEQNMLAFSQENRSYNQELNYFWSNYLVKNYKFSRTRLQRLVDRYYSTPFINHDDDKYISSVFRGDDRNSVCTLNVVAEQLMRFLNKNQMYGIDVYLQDINGNTLLHHAIMHHDLEVVLFLLRYLCDQKMEAEQELKQLENLDQLDEFYKMLFEQEISLYDQALNQVNSTGDGITHMCFPTVFFQAIFVLLVYGLDVNLKTSSGDTLLHMLSRHGRLNSIKQLQSSCDAVQKKYPGPKAELDFNAQNDLGDTPLHAACKGNMQATYEYLRDYCDGAMTNKKGLRPLQCCKYDWYPSVVEQVEESKKQCNFM
jgi:hypothetical protein